MKETRPKENIMYYLFLQKNTSGLKLSAAIETRLMIFHGRWRLTRREISELIDMLCILSDVLFIYG